MRSGLLVGQLAAGAYNCSAKSTTQLWSPFKESPVHARCGLPDHSHVSCNTCCGDVLLLSGIAHVLVSVCSDHCHTRTHIHMHTHTCTHTHTHTRTHMHTCMLLHLLKEVNLQLLGDVTALKRGPGT